LTHFTNTTCILFSTRRPAHCVACACPNQAMACQAARHAVQHLSHIEKAAIPHTMAQRWIREQLRRSSCALTLHAHLHTCMSLALDSTFALCPLHSCSDLGMLSVCLVVAASEISTLATNYSTAFIAFDTDFVMGNRNAHSACECS
jgi:hypothetical protein